MIRFELEFCVGILIDTPSKHRQQNLDRFINKDRKSSIIRPGFENSPPTLHFMCVIPPSGDWREARPQLGHEIRDGRFSKLVGRWEEVHAYLPRSCSIQNRPRLRSLNCAQYCGKERLQSERKQFV